MSATIAITTDLRSAFGAVRNQGQRPTCLAFAASDVHAGIRKSWAPLSCEFLFYHAQRRGLRPATVGATLPHLLAALRFEGQPQEGGWPYMPVTPQASAWLPPADVGQRFGRMGSGQAGRLDDVAKILDSGQPVVMLMRLSDSFYRPGPDGVVIMSPNEAPLDAVRHAVVAVAHGSVDGQPAVLVRNSWGLGWGQGGHAWLTADFVDPRLFGLAVLGAEIDVHPHPHAA